MRDGREGGVEEIPVPCPHVGTFGAGEDGDGRQGGGGGTAAWEPDWDQILWWGEYNPDTANKGGYGGKVTAMPRGG